MEGLLILDKPAGLSSARAVARVKQMLPRGVRIGHAGTLDPFATGVLILLIGKATRQCERIMSWSKTYETTIKLGATTATDDPESPEQPVAAISPPTRQLVESVIPHFVGSIQQRPPIYSAIKISGRRACDRVRDGQDIQLQPRTVHVHSIDLLAYAWPLLTLRIDCGRGTYIRSIARDLGLELGVGGYLTQLRRTRIGDCTVERAVRLDQLTAQNIVQQIDSTILHQFPSSL